MANKFNFFFFTSIHENLNSSKNRQPPDLTKLKGFVESKIPGDIVINIPNITCSFIQNQLQNLKVSKATGIDELSARYLKLSASVISEPLTKILNLSIDTGTFPDDLKPEASGPVNAHLTPGPGIYFNAFIHVYSPRAEADNPLGTKF